VIQGGKKMESALVEKLSNFIFQFQIFASNIRTVVAVMNAQCTEVYESLGAALG
jgi:hypothetical protein